MLIIFLRPLGRPVFRFHRRVSQAPMIWETYVIEQPSNTGGGKAVQVADIHFYGNNSFIKLLGCSAAFLISVTCSTACLILRSCARASSA